MNCTRRLLLRATAGVTALPLLGQGLGGCTASTPLTVAFHPWPGYVSLHLADHLGWWDPASIRSLRTASAAASRLALQHGQAQAAALTLDEVLLAHELGLPLCVVALFNLSVGADVVLARPGWDSPTRWRGARLGLERGSVGELLANSWLERAGLQRGDVRLHYIEVDRHETAWQRDEIDLLVTYEPVASRLRQRGALLLFDSRELPPDRPIADVLAVHRAALRSHAHALSALIASLFQAQRHLHHLPEDSSYRLAPWLQLPRSDVLTAFQGLRLTHAADNRDWLRGTPPRLLTAARSMAAFMHAHGLLRTDQPPAEIILGDFLPTGVPA